MAIGHQNFFPFLLDSHGSIQLDEHARKEHSTCRSVVRRDQYSAHKGNVRAWAQAIPNIFTHKDKPFSMVRKT